MRAIVFSAVMLACLLAGCLEQGSCSALRESCRTPGDCCDRMNCLAINSETGIGQCGYPRVDCSKIGESCKSMEDCCVVGPCANNTCYGSFP